MDLDQQIEIIRSMANPDVSTELGYHLSIDREEGSDEGDEPYTLLSAFDDVFDRMDGSEAEYTKAFVRNMRQIAIALGRYRVVTDAELANSISTNKGYAFKLDGKKYEFVG